MVSSDYYVQDNSDIESKTIQAAKEHFRNGKYSDALKLYLSLINTSFSYKLYYDIGKCYYKLEEFIKSKEYFQKSIGLESYNNPSYLYLGNIHYKQSDLDNAIEYWSEAFSQKPEEEATCLNLATSYFTKKMKFQAFYYYEKYLKYAKEDSTSYKAIKESIDKCNEIGIDFLQKAKRSVDSKNNKAAIEYLSFAVSNVPISFDINHFLGKLYLEEKDYMHALIYLRQALCRDFRSLDVLQNLATVYINLGDYTATYCTLRRLLPLLIHNQGEYLKTIKLIKELQQTFDDLSYQGHLEWAKKYDSEKNYHMAIIEYENCLILKENIGNDISERIKKLKLFINPEDTLIRQCMERGGVAYSNEDYKTSNKYFSRVILMANKNSSEYKTAKSRVINV